MDESMGKGKDSRHSQILLLSRGYPRPLSPTKRKAQWNIKVGVSHKHENLQKRNEVLVKMGHFRMF